MAGEEEFDEFSSFFKGTPPKVMISTNKAPSVFLHTFIADMQAVIPNSAYYKRGTFELKHVCEMATKRDFTDIIIINENKKKPNALLLIHLPDGPTAHFKAPPLILVLPAAHALLRSNRACPRQLNSIVLAKDVFNHARPSDHQPELILNNFSTRLGARIARFFTALLPQARAYLVLENAKFDLIAIVQVPEFEGRRVVTFHNQRDFIFFRHHRCTSHHPLYDALHYVIESPPSWPGTCSKVTKGQGFRRLARGSR